jgi:hypothetical protein
MNISVLQQNPCMVITPAIRLGNGAFEYGRVFVPAFADKNLG